MRFMVVVFLTLLAGCATAPSTQPDLDAADTERVQAFTHYMTGLIRQRDGQYEQAVHELRQASDLKPDSILLNIRLVQYYLDMQDLPNAELMCKRVLKLKNDDASLWIVLGRIYQEEKKFEDAAQAFQKATDLKPTSPEDFQRLILAGEQTNDEITTIDVLEKFIEMNPHSPQLQLQLGMSYMRVNDIEKARAALDAALAEDAGLAQARTLLGICLLELDKPDLAAEQLQKFLAQFPDDDEARQYLASAMARQQQYAAAADEFGKIVARGHAKPEQYLDQMYLLIRAGKAKEAADIVPPSGVPIFGTLFRAWARKASGQPYRPLLDSLDNVEGEIDAECSGYLNGMLFRFGDKDTGGTLVTMLTALRDEGVKSKRVDIILSRTYISLEKQNEAQKILEADLTAFPQDKWIHYYLGTVYEAQDQVKEAEKQLRAALEIDPQDAEIMNYLGYMYADHNTKLDEAKKLLDRAIAVDPDNGYYLDSLGWIYHQQGKADLAIETIRKAIVAMPSDDATLREHLGDAYLLKGDVSRAVGEWQRARRLDPKLEGVQAKIDKYIKKIKK